MRGPSACVVGCVVFLAFAACGGGDQIGPSADDGGTSSGDLDAGDADEGPPPPTAGSGTRFRTMHVVQHWSDGTVLRILDDSFYDKELVAVCDLLSVTGDTYACVPFSEPNSVVSAHEGFADDKCTMPVLALDSSLDTGRWVMWGPQCARKFGVSPPSAQMKKGSSTFRVNEQTQSCEAWEGDVTTMPVPPEIPASTFGVFTRKIETAPFPGERSGTRLVLESERFDSPDGAFEWRAPRIIDSARKSSGTITGGIDGLLHFFTLHGTVNVSDETYSDATCMTNGVISFENDNALCNDPWRPRNGGRNVFAADPACHGTSEIVRPQSHLPLTYVKPGASCLPESGNSDNSFVAQPLVEVAYSDLAIVTRSYTPIMPADSTFGSKLALRALTYTSSDGLSVRARKGTKWLSDLDLPCEVDSSNECLPDAYYADGNEGLYTDAACTDPLLLMSPACGEPVPTLIQSYSGSAKVLRRVPPEAIFGEKSLFRLVNGTTCTAEATMPGYVYIRNSLTTNAFPTNAFPKLTKTDIVTD